MLNLCRYAFVFPCAVIIAVRFGDIFSAVLMLWCILKCITGIETISGPNRWNHVA
jgi:hypothetical protein